MFKNLKIQNRLMLMIMAIVLVGLSIAGWNIYHQIQLINQTSQIEDYSEKVSLLKENRDTFQQSVLDIKNYFLTNSRALLTSYGSNLEQTNQQMISFLSTAASESERENLNALQTAILDYSLTIDETVEYWNAGESERLETLLGQVDDDSTAVLSLYNNLIYEQEITLQTAIGQVDEMVQRSVTLNVGGILLMILCSIFAAVITNQVAEPLLFLTNAVVSFENNAYQDDLLDDYVTSKDEMGQLAQAISKMTASITSSVREKDRFLDATSRFVPSEYLDFLEKQDITQVHLGDHVSAEMAIMFSDIRSFTTISENMTPQENFDFVNEYLALVTPIIKENNGFVVKFLGDGMMAIFPYSVDDAIQAGIEKKQLVNTFNEHRLKNNLAPISVGIGIHIGHMMVGVIGEDRRMQGDAFSDNVNLTSRVEGLTKFYGVSLIVTEEALQFSKLQDRYLSRFLGKALVVGKKLPLSLHEIIDGDPPELLRSKQQILDHFNHGLNHYLAGQLTQAQKDFSTVLENNPKDKAATYYYERTAALLQTGLPPNWEGIEVITGK